LAFVRPMYPSTSLRKIPLDPQQNLSLSPRRIGQLICEGEAFFSRKGIHPGRLTAELLLAKVLQCDRPILYHRIDEEVAKASMEEFYRLLKMRGSHYPLQYLTGHQEFWSLDLLVSPGVFIPRPDTEVLVEAVIRHNTSPNPLIVDLGTGCGNIAIALASEIPRCQIYAVDISPHALKVARRNAHRHRVSDRIVFVEGDLFTRLEHLGLHHRIDWVVSNPPYITESQLNSLQPEVKRYEPPLSYRAPGGGLHIYQRIITESEGFLREEGHLAVEVGAGQHQKIAALFAQRSHWKVIEMRADLGSIPRTLVARFCPLHKG